MSNDPLDIAILRLVRNGNSMHKIASALNISSFTVQRRIHLLAKKGLIARPSDFGRILTPEGEKTANDLGMGSNAERLFRR